MLNATYSSLELLPQLILGNEKLTIPYIIAAVLLNLPVTIIVLNVLWQLLTPKDPNLPPVVFHWIPIFGSAASYGNDPINFLMNCRKKYGDVFTFILFGRRMTVALGPKGNHFVLGGKLAHVSAEDAYTYLTTPVFGKDVVYDVPNHVFMEQKRFVKFGLSLDNFRVYVRMIEEEVENFLDTDPSFVVYGLGDINEWGIFKAKDKMSELTILTASRTLQGKEVRENLDATFAQRYDDLDHGFTPLNFLFPSLPLPSYKRRDKAQIEMSDFFVDILHNRKKLSLEHDHDMLAALSQQTYKNGRPLTDREIAHIMIALLMAGQHTSSATSSWALLHIAQRPDIAEAIYEEQVKYFSTGEEGKFRTMEYEEMKNLDVLNSVIRETLRLHPPIHSIMRKVVSDMPVPPTLAAPGKDRTYVIPKGHYVLASPAVSQVDPNLWKSPKEWDPFRWTDPEGLAAQASKQYDDAEGEKVDYGFGAVSKGTESPYQPFGAGRHRCIGEQFAYLQLGVILATFVRKMELKLQRAFPAENFHTMITSPKQPDNILYRRRNFD